MDLITTLEHIAEDFNFPAIHLINYALEDFSLGGYHPDRNQAKWDQGSMFGVEGQILYALIRYLRPKLAVELGSFKGCSTHHIVSAMEKNMLDGDVGKLVCVDVGFMFPPIKTDLEVCYVTGDAIEWLDNDMPLHKVDFLFEDLFHETPQVTDVWKRFVAKAKKGAMIVSHDAMHPGVGQKVALGILGAGVTDAKAYLTEPSDCGLALYRMPTPKVTRAEMGLK